MSRVTTCLAVIVLAAAPLSADDPWEGTGDDDAAASTLNVLRHGVVQRNHDLHSVLSNPDVDWMRIVVTNLHSYEARVSGLYWDDGCVDPGPCPRFDHVLADGTTVATAGVASSEDVDQGTHTLGRTVRFIVSNGNQQAFLRAAGQEGAFLGPLPYDVVIHDTTMFVPRWNNTATQTTILLLQNTTNAGVQGFVYFHDAAGVPLSTHAFDLPEHGLGVIATAAIPGLAGRSGSAQIAHLGGYGAIAGKAVALEPATGFTFDTAITPVPR